MEEWARQLREAPYPGGTLGFVLLDLIGSFSFLGALIAIPLDIWAMRHAKAKAGNVS